MLKRCEEIHHYVEQVTYVKDYLPFLNARHYSRGQIKASKVECHCEWLQKIIEGKAEIYESVPVPLERTSLWVYNEIRLAKGLPLLF
jgi:hypothetical protein